MAATTKTQRTCSKGHRYYKSSDCPTCPVCENESKPDSGFLALLSAPARRALENEGIVTLDQLSGFTEREILKLHGVGKASLPTLRKLLAEASMSFSG